MTVSELDKLVIVKDGAYDLLITDWKAMHGALRTLLTNGWQISKEHLALVSTTLENLKLKP